jgi:RHS repeat-associated protein
VIDLYPEAVHKKKSSPSSRPSTSNGWGEKASSEKTTAPAKASYTLGSAWVAAKSHTSNFGPFGETIRASGEMAKANSFRFSTKYQDDETGLLYYGYRWYDPSTGRFLSRDPIQENDGPNVYALVKNNPLNKIDILGLKTMDECIDFAVRKFVINSKGVLLDYQVNRDLFVIAAYDIEAQETLANFLSGTRTTVLTAGAGAIAQGVLKLAQANNIARAANVLNAATIAANQGLSHISRINEAAAILAHVRTATALKGAYLSLGAGASVGILTADNFGDFGRGIIGNIGSELTPRAKPIFEIGTALTDYLIKQINLEKQIMAEALPGIVQAGNYGNSKLKRVRTAFEKDLKECNECEVPEKYR